MIMPYSILIFNKKNGTRFSIFIFIILIFYFWTPYGKSFLNYAYTDDFISRFPILYLSNFILVYTYEFIRSATYTELVDTKEYYKQLMNKDELTQLPNRKLFNSKFNTLLTNPLKTQSSMMIIDIDDFKLVNDKYSHLDGDKVLRDLTQLVSNLLPNPTFFCRWGGEEFVILMEFYNKDESKLLAETIRLKIKNNTFYSLDDQVLNVTVSIGVTSFISSIIGSQKTIFSYADQALHLAKNRGKNQIVHMETK
jgi:diguanylate cyclase (GGDEF)-like protein